MIKNFILFIFIVSSNLLYSQTLVSQFDFLVADLKVATKGNSGLSYNAVHAKLAAGGGVYFINSGGNTGLDLEIPRADFENLESVTFSFDYKRLEKYATFFEMDEFKFHMDNGEVKIEYKVVGKSKITFNTGYTIPNKARILLKVTYDKASGELKVYENNNLKATNTTTAGKALDWSSASGNAYVGKQMDGSGSTTASLYQFQIYNEASSTLPIDLISFDAKYNNHQTIINWTTATEINNQYFEIQRSTDNENFETIATINGAGNSNQIIDYTYTDYYSSKTAVYYKLKQVDFDGKFEFSNTISVSKLHSNNTKIFPNPVSSDETFSIKTNDGNRVIIYNSIGQTIKDLKVDNRTINLNLIQSGIYFIVVFDELGNKILSEELMVK